MKKVNQCGLIWKKFKTKPAMFVSYMAGSNGIEEQPRSLDFATFWITLDYYGR